MSRVGLVFNALADPSRRAIFERLTHGETAVNGLTACFDISQPAVSQHLATLKKAGLVACRRDGRASYYRVRPRGLTPMIDWMTRTQQFWSDRLEHLDALLEGMDQ